MSEDNLHRLEIIKRDWYDEKCIDSKDIEWLLKQTDRVKDLEKMVEGYRSNWYKCVENNAN